MIIYENMSRSVRYDFKLICDLEHDLVCATASAYWEDFAEKIADTFCEMADEFTEAAIRVSVMDTNTGEIVTHGLVEEDEDGNKYYIAEWRVEE